MEPTLGPDDSTVTANQAEPDDDSTTTGPTQGSITENPWLETERHNSLEATTTGPLAAPIQHLEDNHRSEFSISDINIPSQNTALPSLSLLRNNTPENSHHQAIDSWREFFEQNKHAKPTDTAETTPTQTPTPESSRRFRQDKLLHIDQDKNTPYGDTRRKKPQGINGSTG
jgi:hypothetical protein